uniref:Potassium channel domain-containing protein n=1 Tax=Babesia bovis TaxID=5865 RepID=A7AT63_BABBO|eukprot:XP_001609692.1 hypothetical protein [Babesia bovis T2Bo]
MTNAFASVMYVLQGIHPNSGVDSAFKHAFKQYGEFFYYSLITFSTVGYGDITPLTIEAKLVALCFIIFMLVWIPYEMNNFIQGVDREKEISGHLYFWGSMQSSIVLIGEVDPIQLSLFIAKIYYSGLKLKIIVISTLSMSSYEIQINQAKILRVSLCIVLDDPGINGNVDILHTIKAKDAVGTFVLSSFKHGDPRKADMKTVGRVISLKKFGISADRVIIQYCSTLRPQIAHRPYTNVVNLYRFKSAIIAKNITCPGIITLIINLSLTHSAIVQRCKGDDLYDNYVRGIGRRLRTIAISERLVGTDFDTLCSNLYNIHGYIVIGIIHGNHNYRTYQLNPSGSGYMIRPGDRAVLVADVESSSKTKHDIVTSGRNSTVPIRSSMISLVLNRIGSDITASLDEMDNDGNLYPMLNQPSLDNGVDNKVHEDALVLQVSPTENNSIIVDSICQACRTVFQDPCRPVMVIVGYSEFVIQLLLYFQELDEFNVVIFGKEVSVKVNPLPLQRFKAFLALIDGDPMSDVDVKRAELFMACYIYVIPSPELDAPGDSEADLDVRTIVTYRHLKSLIQASIKKRGKSKTGTSIYGLVELKCGTNVSYLDDTMWSAWNVLDKKLDPSLSYIHSVEFSRGQFISDEMLYSVTMNTMFIHEDYALYRILFDLVSVSAIDGDTRGIELLPVEDIITQCSKPTFGQLFNYMHTKMHIIPIGIYRM